MPIDKRMPIMVVDDYAVMLRIIHNLLRELGFLNVTETSTGGEALEKLRGGQYGLILSDWNMQPMTGLDLLREVRGDPRLQHIPFIMVTAESKTENVVAARQGVSNYIVKPFNAETLKSKMMSVLGPF